MRDSDSPKSEEPDDSNKGVPEERGASVLLTTAFDLVIILTEISQDEALTPVTWVSALVLAAKVVIAVNR